MSQWLAFIALAWKVFLLFLSEKDEGKRRDIARKLDASLNFARETGDTSLLEQTIRENYHSPFKGDK